MPLTHLSVCAIFRDEASYLEEWLDFHLLMGVGHFYLHDNHSSDSPEVVLRPYLERGRATDRFVHRAETRWLRNQKVKSVVDPERTVRGFGPHFFRYRDDALAVDERIRPVRPAWVSGPLRQALSRQLVRFWPELPVDPFGVRGRSHREVTAERFRVHHYAVKSLAEYQAKRARGGISSYDLTYFRYHDRNQVQDPTLQGAPGGRTPAGPGVHGVLIPARRNPWVSESFF